MGELIGRYDWSASSLGPISTWPQSLRSAVSLCVKSPFPIIIYWGWPDLTVLYNDAFMPVIGDAHPNALGQPLFQSWPELRPTLESLLERVLKSGTGMVSEDFFHVCPSSGNLEERYFTVAFSPITLESGETGGSFSVVENATDRVIGARRLRTLGDLAMRPANAKAIDEACRIATDVLAENRQDLPFALLYLIDNDRQQAHLAANVALNSLGTASPRTVHLAGAERRAACPVALVANTNTVQPVADFEQAFGPLPSGSGKTSPVRALAMPITPSGHALPAAVLLAGIGARSAPDDAHHRFLNSVADQIAATIARVTAYQALAIRHMVGVLNTEGTPLCTDQTMVDYTGLTVEEVLAPNFHDRAFHREDVARLREERAAALRGSVPFTNEQRIRRKDGQYRWFFFQYIPLLDDRQRVIRWYTTATDIDDRVRKEELVRNENLALREQIDRDSMFEDIVGSSLPLRRVLSQISKVAPSDSTILILGETGTGKELIARAIHKRSPRADRAFLAVNCAAIPGSLIASELFGHEKGAFTGATHKRLGRFEAANGGTLFLDEVGDLPEAIQIALLRVLQERQIERVGSDRAFPVDVRVLAATHRDLAALVAEGKFRQDLLYRLNVVPIEMPSLRERAADIPLLVEYFIDRLGKKAGKKFRTIDPGALRLFQAYRWPGNIRELQNVVERAVILSDGDTFSIDETWLKLEAAPVAESQFALDATLLRQEKEMIEAALAESCGKISGPAGAASKLGLPARTLDSKIKRLEIDKYRFKVARSD